MNCYLAICRTVHGSNLRSLRSRRGLPRLPAMPGYPASESHRRRAPRRPSGGFTSPLRTLTPRGSVLEKAIRDCPWRGLPCHPGGTQAKHLGFAATGTLQDSAIRNMTPPESSASRAGQTNCWKPVRHCFDLNRWAVNCVRPSRSTGGRRASPVGALYVKYWFSRELYVLRGAGAV